MRWVLSELIREVPESDLGWIAEELGVNPYNPFVEIPGDSARTNILEALEG